MLSQNTILLPIHTDYATTIVEGPNSHYISTMYIIIPAPNVCVDLFNNQPIIQGYNKVVYKKIVKYLTHLFVPYWNKLNFRGKGFRIRNFGKRKRFTFNFGLSHWARLLYKKNVWYFMRKKRQNHVFWCFDKLNFYSFGNIIRNIKKINRYTKRGLRLRKQYIIKRFGKISQVVSSLQM